jgi:hypothetical protein
MRKSKTITLDDRGSKRTFKITEMPATKQEAWLIKVGILMSALVDGVESGVGRNDFRDLEGLAKKLLAHGIGQLSNLEYEKAKPLLDELLLCCARIDGGVEQLCTPDSVDGYIEDVKTLFLLRKEALEINLGFLADASASSSQPSNPIISIPRNEAN